MPCTDGGPSYVTTDDLAAIQRKYDDLKVRADEATRLLCQFGPLVPGNKRSEELVRWLAKHQGHRRQNRCPGKTQGEHHQEEEEVSLDYIIVEFDIPQAVPSDDDLRPAVLEAIHRTAARAGLRSAPRSIVLGEAMRNLKGKANPTQVLKIIDDEMEKLTAVA